LIVGIRFPDPKIDYFRSSMGKKAMLQKGGNYTVDRTILARGWRKLLVAGCLRSSEAAYQPTTSSQQLLFLDTPDKSAYRFSAVRRHSNPRFCRHFGRAARCWGSKIHHVQF
jgi:hypothetical protein